MPISTSEAARALGSVRSERKAESSRRNAQKRRREPVCSCGQGDGEWRSHKSKCRVYQTWFQRERRRQKNS